MNKKLIDYIKKESQRGVSTEATRNALLTVGWSELDIRKAYGSLSTQTPASKFNIKIILIVIVLMLIIAGGAWAFFNYVSMPTGLTPPVVDTESAPAPSTAPTPASTPAPVVTEVSKVTTILNEMCKGYLTGDNSLILKHASAKTISLIFTNVLTPASSCTINDVYQTDGTIFSSVEIIPAASLKPGAETSNIHDMVFINEGDNWKFDLAASQKFTADQNKIKILGGDSKGSVDLIVTNVVISPIHPIVNNGGLKIVVTIKNTGTKTSEVGTPLIATLLGFTDAIPMKGGTYDPLLAGSTTEWIWYPYKYNDLLKIKDVAGPKTIKIEVNPGLKITEGNYDNNIFTKDIQIYAK